MKLIELDIKLNLNSSTGYQKSTIVAIYLILCIKHGRGLILDNDGTIYNVQNMNPESLISI